MANVWQDLQNLAWHQIQDSPGPHHAAIVTPGTFDSPMRIQWQSSKREVPPLKYDNLYVWHENGAPNADTFSYAISVSVPTQEILQNTNTVECETDWVNTKKLRFNSGLQARLGAKEWFCFNLSVGAWVPTGVAILPTDFSPVRQTSIETVFKEEGNATRWLGIAVNGKWNPLSLILPGKPSTEAPRMNNAVQIGSKNNGAMLGLDLYQCCVTGLP